MWSKYGTRLFFSCAAYTIFTMVIVVQPQSESEYGKDSVASDMAKILLQHYPLEQKAQKNQGFQNTKLEQDNKYVSVFILKGNSDKN